MKRSPPASRDVFVVRRWRNPTDETWRSQVVLVVSGQTISFSSDEELLRYIRQRFHEQAEMVSRASLR